MDEYLKAIEEMKQAQNEYPPERVAHDAWMELKELVTLLDHWNDVTLKEAATLEQAVIICRRLASA